MFEMHHFRQMQLAQFQLFCIEEDGEEEAKKTSVDLFLGIHFKICSIEISCQKLHWHSILFEGGHDILEH